MNPCERIARLNPTSIRFDVGRGGKPELTPQDIAAAIGMVGNDPTSSDERRAELVFAREVFCAIWWPDGAQLVWRELDAMIAEIQFAEWRDRADQFVTAQIRMAQASNQWHKHDLGRAKLVLDKAKERMWPALNEDPYRFMRRGVIAELRASRICPVCNGRREVKAAGLLVSCENCHASGRIAVSDNQRALMMKRDHATYRRTWRPVYEWTYQKVADAEATGREEISQRLDNAA